MIACYILTHYCTLTCTYYYVNKYTQNVPSHSGNIKRTVVNKNSGKMSESCRQATKDAMLSTDNKYGYTVKGFVRVAAN